MKKFLYFLIFFGCICAAQNRPIITKWKASGGKITIGVESAGIGSACPFWYTYQEVGSTVVSPEYYAVYSSTTINVPTNGEYIVSITPNPSYGFRFRTKNPQFLEIMQWGDVRWRTDLSFMFSGCINLKFTATDIPDFSAVTNMQGMFSECPNLDNIPNINNWNVSKVTNMKQMFKYCTTFNSDITSWNTSNVITLNETFAETLYFNQNLKNWNVSNVVDMRGTFQNAKAFNGNLSNWNTSRVNYMEHMFDRASAFNQDISNWNVSNVSSMEGMFAYATAFNQDIGRWNVSHVSSMTDMFYNAVAFNQDISNWNVSNTTNMNSMFREAYAFNQNIGQWNVSNVVNMDWMFLNASAFNQNLGNWKLNNNVQLGGFLQNSGLSCQNYALTLKGWAENPRIPRERFLGAFYIKYGSMGKTYRDLLTTWNGWTIQGDTFVPTCNDALATDENSLKEKLNFYPNPTTGRIVYQSQNDESLQVTNTAGQLLKTIKVTKGANQIDISEFPKGVYFLKAGNKTSKLLKN